jgi:hypothetical protein
MRNRRSQFGPKQLSIGIGNVCPTKKVLRGEALDCDI